MLDLPGQPVIDKAALVGGCLRLPVQIDAQGMLFIYPGPQSIAMWMENTRCA